MELSRPIQGWKRYFDPITWSGVQAIGEAAIPVIPCLPIGRRLNRMAPRSNIRSGLIMALASGAADDVSWYLGDGTPTLSYEVDAVTAADVELGSMLGPISGRIWIITNLSAYSNETASRYQEVWLQSAGATHRVEILTAGGTPIDGNAKLVCPITPILVRSGWTLGTSISALTVGKATFLRFSFIEFDEDEPIPWL